MSTGGMGAEAAPDRGRVLVAEDGPIFRNALIRMLTLEGYDVEAYPDGTSALEALRAAESPFDLLIFDVVMPGLTGVELADRVRELLPRVPPLLLMSGEVGSGRAHEPDRLGGEHILRKPFTAEELFAAIAGIM